MVHKSAKRIIQSFLRPFEIKALNYLVKKLPLSVRPNDLTAIGFLGAVLIAVGYYLCNFGYGWLWLANIGFLVNWFGDSLDGTVARYRKIERPLYGFYIDHNVDAMTISIIGIGLGLSPFMRFDIAMYSILGYLLLSIHTYINAYLAGFFKISYNGIGPTEARAIVVIINTILFFIHKNPKVHNLNLTYFDIGGIIFGSILIIVFIIAYFSDKKVLKKKDPPKV